LKAYEQPVARAQEDRITAEVLSEEELERYSRQIMLDDIGFSGQLRLKQAKVCIVGLGGLGVPTAQKLAAMGVGHLRVVDRDVVSPSDLPRQYLYDADSIGYSKVEVAAKKLEMLNPNVKFDPIPASVTSSNGHEIVKGVDVVIDGLDSIETRYLINRACVNLGVPYLYGGAIKSQGNALTILPGKTPCLECIYPGLEDEALPKCSIVGVHPSVLSIVSSVQVSEAIRLLTGRQPELLNKLLLIDLESLSFDKLKLTRHEKCPVCGDKPNASLAPLKDRFFEEECARSGKRTFVLTPKKHVEVNLKELLEILEARGARMTARGDLCLTFDYDPALTLSILKSGIMIAQLSPHGGLVDARQGIIQTYHSIMVEDLGVDRDALPDLPQLAPRGRAHTS